MPLPLGWQLTNHTRRRIELRLDSEVEPLPEQPLPKGSDFALPAPAANLLRQFGEDVWLFPDISWTTAAYNGIRKKLSPVP
jgi:hypothetical protein